jgi:hypothetical protein
MIYALRTDFVVLMYLLSAALLPAAPNVCSAATRHVVLQTTPYATTIRHLIIYLELASPPSFARISKASHPSQIESYPPI